MNIKNSLILILLLILCLPSVAVAQRSAPRGATPAVRRSARVLLIPLDDRPPCLQFVELMARIGDAEIVAPPREMLGRFTEPGKPEAIAAWLDAQNLRSFDAAIISLDMVAYGGLVNSRVFRTSLAEADKRLRVIETINRRAPRLPIYGFSVVMRLAPTSDGKNEAYRERLARWAEISPEAERDSTLKNEVARLEREIPAVALNDYKQARARNFAVNRKAIELARKGIIKHLILSQDDAKLRGIHIRDRERLIDEARRLKLQNRIAVQPGADEVAMLLLARALNVRFNFYPRIAAVYSSRETRNAVAPFEDKPVNQTVSYHIKSIGAHETTNAKAADILFYVYASRFEAGMAESFAAEVARAVESGKQVIVADIDMKGDLQGADARFTEELRRRNLFPRLAGYASWNTAGNTIGTALPHGAIFTLAATKLFGINKARDARVAEAQIKFLLHRLIDDYAYHAIVRPAAKKFAVARNLNPNNLKNADIQLVENYTREQLAPLVKSFVEDFSRTFTVNSPRSRSYRPAFDTSFEFALPWGRTFEAEIDFKTDAKEVSISSISQRANF